ILAAALLALIPLMLVQQLTSTALFHAETLPIVVYALGVLALGLLDDTLARGPGDGSPTRLARARSGAAARRALHRCAQGGRLARAGTAGDELPGALQRALAAGGGRAGPRDQRVQPARPAPRALDEGAPAPRRRLHGRLGRDAPAVDARPVRRARARGRLLRPARAGDARRHRGQPPGRARRPVAGAHAVRDRAAGGARTARRDHRLWRVALNFRVCRTDTRAARTRLLGQALMTSHT